MMDDEAAIPDSNIAKLLTDIHQVHLDVNISNYSARHILHVYTYAYLHIYTACIYAC